MNAPLAALAAAALAAWDQGSGGAPFFRDRFYYFEPLYASCREALAGGEIPLWNPRINCGQPLLATWQAGLGCPLLLPFLLLPWEPACRLFWFGALGTAAAGAYALGTRAGLAPAGAATAAALFACSGPLRTLGEWPNIVAALALLPGWLAALADLARARRGAVPAAGLLGAMILLAGQPRQALIAGLAGWLWLAVLRRDAARPGGRRLAAALAAAACLALAVAAWQLAASGDLYLRSGRRAHGVPAATVAESYLGWRDLLTTAWARAGGDEHAASGPGRLLQPRLYVGVLGLWLAARGAARAPRAVRAFAVAAIPAGLLLALRGPVAEAVAGAAGRGPALRFMGHFVLAGFPALCLLAGAGAAAIRSRRARALLPFLIAADGVAALHGYQAAVPGGLGVPAVSARPALVDGRIWAPVRSGNPYPGAEALPLADRYRLQARLLAPNLPSAAGLRNAAGYEPFAPSLAAELLAAPPGAAPPTESLAAAGVRWAVAPDGERRPGWRHAEPLAPGWSLWELPAPAQIEELLPPAALALPWSAWRALPRRGPARAGPETWNTRRVVVVPRAPALLIVRTLWDPGWRAFAGTRPVPVRRAGGIFLGVPLPGPGKPATVTLAYAPRPFALGWLAAAALLGALIALGLLPPSSAEDRRA